MTQEKKKVFITTAIDYTNDVIHIGHAYQKILADCLARFFRSEKGEENVFFTTGTDEFGTTNEKAALKRDVPPQQHVDEISAKDKAQLDALDISYDRFIRTTDSDHQKAAAAFFQKSYDNGDIYKDTYEGLYCEGCEAHKTLSELNEAGQCLFHTTREIQKVAEENYFFKWSKYADFLKELIESEELLVLPESKRNEMLAFIESGINDIPITRPKHKVSWGIDCPIDNTQVIYVWFDALINYYTAAEPKGFWDDDTQIIHVLGKDNARWHALLWPAMLKSVGYRLPNVVYVHSFINLNGEKISKSLGNVILPTELVEKYGVDPVRYYFLKHGPIVDDVNISIERFEEVYNADLANGLGNTVARIAKLAENSGLEFETDSGEKVEWSQEQLSNWTNYRVDLVLQKIWQKLSGIDNDINHYEPWKLLESNDEELQRIFKQTLDDEIAKLRTVTKMLKPFLPSTAEKILTQFKGPKIKAERPLFPRIQ